MQYTVDYFIKKFEAIPEKNWCTDVWYRDDACCAIGHCGIKHYVFDEDQTEANALRDILGADHVIHVSHINDGKDNRYQQPTPKQRILAALYDIKRMQSPVEEPKVKEIIRYVAVPETISEMETVLN